MNAVLGMTDLLRLTNLTRKQQGYIQTIQSSGNMLLSLVDNILDFSRLGAGALVIQKREFNVLELLERVLEIVGYHACSKGLELVGVLDADLTLRVSGDRYRLRQILVNLSRNAVTFSNEGEVVIRISIDTEWDGLINLLFTVSDQGSGMSDEVKTRLFKPFANVGQQQAGQQGSGLGLTICKQLVEEMGGDISIDSKSGEGTRVRFTVPVERKVPTDDNVAANMPALRGRRVLALHNSPIIDQAICGYAMACGMCCEIAASEEEALDLLQAASRTDQPFAAAIIDSTIHDSCGLTLARRIRTTDAISLIPIVLLASISKPLEPGKVSSVGRIRCINKPILPSELLQSLQHLIENGRPAAANEVLTGNQVAESTERRVLVAEDNPVNRQVLTGMLESLGYAADCVEDGPTALEVLSERPYDIVLMDCQMPGMDGEQVSRSSSLSPRTRHSSIAQSALRRAWMISSANLSASASSNQDWNDGRRCSSHAKTTRTLQDRSQLVITSCLPNFSSASDHRTSCFSATTSTCFFRTLQCDCRNWPERWKNRMRPP
jgi:CheY-like chemotaxis protein/anti-sigma regulatory factor (Ser/Thr protein kinase)